MPLRVRRPERRLLLALVACLGGTAMAAGEMRVTLPEPSLEGEVPVERAIAERRSVRAFARQPLTLANASQLLWAAQGLTDPSGLRAAPSAGALYPLEISLVAGNVSGLRAGVYRYEPRRHRLVLRREGDLRSEVAKAALDQDWVAEAPAILVIAAVPRRTTRKYGARAERYVYIEAGHAAQNVYLQAGALGLGTTIVGAFRDAKLARILGLAEQEQSLALLPIGTPRREPAR
jgi:SagB-type dehydrogenase family enzyme